MEEEAGKAVEGLGLAGGVGRGRQLLSPPFLHFFFCKCFGSTLSFKKETNRTGFGANSGCSISFLWGGLRSIWSKLSYLMLSTILSINHCRSKNQHFKYDHWVS